jgi:hypothetical protein
LDNVGVASERIGYHGDIEGQRAHASGVDGLGVGVHIVDNVGVASERIGYHRDIEGKPPDGCGVDGLGVGVHIVDNVGVASERIGYHRDIEGQPPDASGVGDKGEKVTFWQMKGLNWRVAVMSTEWEKKIMPVVLMMRGK